ncbi:MAG: hypothetical protein HC908_13020 [Calothrix sp. SM1_7_51]|nr:hypothetical protein [Calothrix sp. SM1_7_51]
MIFLRSLPQTFRYLEWIFLTAYFGMCLSGESYNFPGFIGLSSILFLLSCIYPNNRPYWQRFCYIIAGILTVLCGGLIGFEFSLFLFIYISKSYFLLQNRRTMIGIACLSSNTLDYQ